MSEPDFTPKDSFTNPEVQRCPFKLISRLHAEAPVYRDPVTGFFIITRYQDLADVSADTERFTNKTALINAPAAPEVRQLYAERGFERKHTLVTNDPPSHTAFRGLVDKVFSPAFVRSLGPLIEDIAIDLIDDFIEAGEANLLQDFCLKLPMFVIADQLGVPRADWRVFKEWSDAEIAAINPALALEERLRLSNLIIDAQNYLFERAQDYRRAPNDKLLSLVANAKLDGQYLDDVDLVSILEQLLVAGNETTTSALAHALNVLIENPALKAALLAAPDKIDAFTEEVLRKHAPSPHLYREALVDCDVGGVAIPKGAILQISYLAANHDPTHYERPEEIDLDRPGIRNHMAFGRGIHYCLGNRLARAELVVGVRLILERIPDMRHSPYHPRPRFAESYHVHTLDSLFVSFTPGQRANKSMQKTISKETSDASQSQPHLGRPRS